MSGNKRQKIDEGRELPRKISHIPMPKVAPPKPEPTQKKEQK